ncbi:SusC/RagA family TonB-linked outer membrane protein [Chitinophaga sancti]|uniref:SusC/RagA family TonB-linked outer membrane protein n=1 Tax=Chitinophaga sancti TaxID=1004 RepID=A0A1K1QD00_9BACT|nr:SusC/RagA family TonB-linked outer membrane protein [Chitinophaga sancti]WQD61378.1 SusC/RagA family TonB-linked outer membrane protein [Chitinophaga sancti]WQG93069.1 SusC/RagA family TonB-linked outer membrane protein [Chitinophaga sancti]SFW57613.1 TonB-linked outer membrane protein, SusC/RagA family [Chitinophaga sancti]
MNFKNLCGLPYARRKRNVRTPAFLKLTGIFFVSAQLGAATAGYSAIYNRVPDASFSSRFFKEITGKVTTANGQPLPGVSISVKGTTRGAVTNPQGEFTINANPGDVLLISFIGFSTQQITVTDKTTALSIRMEEGATKLNDVVVTALGIKKENRSIGYSTTQLSGAAFTQSREVNIGNALTGKVAGVSVANNATGPSGSSRVIIRGNASLTGNNQPLYVIDGVPFDNAAQGSAGQWGGMDLGDGLSNINPDDIADMQVLKGAAASALYGYRGGNGAILITTKSGQKGKGIGVEINNNLTANTIIDYRDLQTVYGQGTQGVKPTSAATAYNTYSSWGAKMDGSDAVNFLGNTYKYNESVGKDNWKNFYRTGLNNQSSVAISGSTDKIKYRVGLSNLHNTSIIPNSGMNQQGINLNTIYNITPKLSLTVTANYIFERVKNRALLSDASTNINATLMYLPTTFDVRWLQPQRQASGVELTPTSGTYFNNPYFLAYQHQNNTDRNRLTAAATLKYNFTDWLYAQGAVQRDGYILDYRKVTPTGTAYANGGELSEYERNYRELNLNYLIGFNKKVGDFSINATFGGNQQDNVNKSYGLNGTASPFIIPYLYTANNIANRTYTQTYAHYRVNSLYGTADFGFRNFLFLNFTGRQDWFSTLDPKSNKYFYPSVSTSFVFSELMHAPKWLSSGKLRASFARASNGTTPYQNYLTYGLQTYTLTGVSVGMITNSTVPNANLKPVKISEKEVGLNMQFLDNRVGFDVAYYYKQTEDDIASVSASTASGYSAAILNVGKIRNQGIEALISGAPVRGKDFSWDATFNIALNSSKVLYLGPGVNSLAIDGAVPRNGDGVTISNVVGLAYGQIMGYAYRRDNSGNKVYAKDGQNLRSSTVVPLGSGVYKTTGGLNNEFHYKNLSLSFLVDFKFGAKVYSGTNLSLYSTGQQKNTLEGRDGGYVGKGVQADGTANTVSIDAQTYWTNLATSNIVAEEFVYDASFIKLRQLSLGYTLPSSLLGDHFFKGVNVSIVTRNLATLLKHTPNIDPESAYNNTNGQGLELNGMPPTRSFGLNVNAKF